MKYSPHLMPQIIGTMFPDLSSFQPKCKVKETFDFLCYSYFSMDITVETFDASNYWDHVPGSMIISTACKVKEFFLSLLYLSFS